MSGENIPSVTQTTSTKINSFSQKLLSYSIFICTFLLLFVSYWKNNYVHKIITTIPRSFLWNCCNGFPNLKFCSPNNCLKRHTCTQLYSNDSEIMPNVWLSSSNSSIKLLLNMLYYNVKVLNPFTHLKVSCFSRTSFCGNTGRNFWNSNQILCPAVIICF